MDVNHNIKDYAYQFWHKYNDNLIQLLIIVILVLIGIRYTLFASRYLDIKLSDESFYLNDGINILRYNINPSEGVLYSLYYYILSIFIKDKIDLFYFNYRLLTVLVPTLAYVLFVKLGSKKLPAFIVSLLILVSNVNTFMYPKIYCFNLCLIIFIMLMSLHIDNELNNIIFISLGMLTISYARPEYILAYILIMSLLLYKSIYEIIRQHTYRGIITLVLLLSLLITLHLTIGVPALSDKYGRSIGAFGQHFSLYWVKWNNSSIEPYTNWENIIKSVFGPVKSISQAMVANPLMFLQHILSNLEQLPFVVINLIKSNTNHILPQSYPWWLDLILLITIPFISISKLCKANLKHTLNKICINKNINLLMLIILCPMIATAIIIYPYPGYILPLILVIGYMLSILIGLYADNKIGILRYLLVILVFIPVIKPLTCFSEPQVNKNTLNVIKSLNLEKHVNLMEGDGGYSNYLGNNFKYIQIGVTREKYISFYKQLNYSNVNMIVVSDSLRNNLSLNSDNEWLQFINNYKNYGFKRFDVFNSNRYILVKNDLLI